MRQRWSAMVLSALLLIGSGAARAHEGEHTSAAKASQPAKAKQATVTGEIVDTGCYLGHAERGPRHKQCAQLCIQKGMPMGLLTDAGDLYLLTPPHSNTAEYKKLKDWAALEVEVTGTVMERNGMKSIEVASARRPPAKAAP
jgi:hypothetical protein